MASFSLAPHGQAVPARRCADASPSVLVCCDVGDWLVQFVRLRALEKVKGKGAAVRTREGTAAPHAPGTQGRSRAQPTTIRVSTFAGGVPRHWIDATIIVSHSESHGAGTRSILRRRTSYARSLTGFVPAGVCLSVPSPPTPAPGVLRRRAG